MSYLKRVKEVKTNKPKHLTLLPTEAIARLMDKLMIETDGDTIIRLVAAHFGKPTNQIYKNVQFSSSTGKPTKRAWLIQEHEDGMLDNIQIILYPRDNRLMLRYHDIDLTPQAEKFFRNIYDSGKEYVVDIDGPIIIKQHYSSYNGGIVHYGIKLRRVEWLHVERRR